MERCAAVCVRRAFSVLQFLSLPSVYAPDGRPGMPYVRKNGENILNKVDRTSNFAGMQMQPGINTVSYAADFGDNSLHVILRYNNQYLGV